MHSLIRLSPSASQCSLLAIDTAFDLCSVALVTPELADIRRSERLRKHADDVLPMIDSLLSTHHLKMTSLDVVAMVSGPGSFTGLRIGTAVVQGLAFGAGLPVVCVSSLAMMARSARRITGSDGVILTCLHAREDEFYFAAYRDTLEDAPHALIPDTIFTVQQIQPGIDHLLSTFENNAGIELTLAGTGWQHVLLTDHVAGSSYRTVTVATDAFVLAELAIQDYQAGRGMDASDATPAYLNDDMKYRTV